MGKKILFLVLGFGMITAGMAGITASVVDQKNKAALSEVEKIKEETKTAAAEEQRKIDEQRQEIEKLALDIEKERKRLEEANRAREEYRLKERASESRRPAPSSGLRAAAPKENPRPRRSESPRKHPLPSATKEDSRQARAQERISPRHPATSGPSRQAMRDDDIKRISRKAGMEAARLSTPVKYYNRKTREVVLAEPVGHRSGSVRVRVRIWRNDRLAKDMLVSFPHASLREMKESRV
jgi:hypothetical protein